MSAHTLVVLSNPVEGREEEYNRWYNEQHIRDVLKVPGVVAASRARMIAGPMGDRHWRYCAFYEIADADPQNVLLELQSRAGGPTMPVSDAMDFPGIYVAVYERLGETCVP